MIIHGDCLEVMKGMEADSVDAIVTDPPYGIAFMGKRWDYDVPSVDVWRECLRVLKPGGHMLVACGTRTQHRMVVNIEDAGFEIRDVVTWLYGQGFPKSLDVSKAIDKEAGAEREVLAIGGDGAKRKPRAMAPGGAVREAVQTISAPATDAAREWEGWGTALKPACEFWTLCRKPLSEPTVAKNVIKWGTGALNIDGCRVGSETRVVPPTGTRIDRCEGRDAEKFQAWQDKQVAKTVEGRFPANLLLDEEAAQALDAQSGVSPSNSRRNKGTGRHMGYGGTNGAGADGFATHDDSGGASRFFYVAKASKSDRGQANTHPTVKPVALMRYLCRLITPPGGLVLDPFAGSGSTGVGALKEGFRFLGIEREEQYVAIAKRRVEAAG